MSYLTPIPAGRVGNFQIRERLMNQLQQDQLALFRAQDQVSSGRRFTVPSEDAPAALRSISLQRLIEQKQQIDTNVQTSLSFVATTDATLTTVSGLLAGIRGSALGVAGTTNTDEQRRAVAEEVDGAIRQLLDLGNQSFRGRHLFAGSRSDAAPYETADGYVRYVGNERKIQSYSNLNSLFDTNLHGVEVFGGISDGVHAEVDLNPHLTAQTQLSSLHGGRGISPNGAVAVSDGENTSVVDLSRAVTIGDVARLIEAAPPEGRTVRVEVTGTGLSIKLDEAGGGNLIVTEVGGGKTARELGIYEDQGVLTEPLIGTDLNPAILPTTPLTNLLGTKATAEVAMSGANNDVTLEATQNGDVFNDVTVRFVNHSLLQAGVGLSAGNEFAEYDTNARAASASLALSGAGNDLILTATTPGADFNDVEIELVDGGDLGAPTATYTDTGTERRLTLTIDDSNETTVADLMAVIDAEGTFTASFDPSSGETFDPAAPVQTADAGVRTGNTGNSGGDAKTLYVFVESGASTAEQAIAAINAEGTFRASLDGRDTFPPNQAGRGVVDLTATATTAGGGGTVLDTGAGLQIANGGETYVIDLSTADTVGDLLNVINGSGADVVAEINAARTAIDIRSRLSGADFSIGENGGQTATQLGVRTFTTETRLDNLNRGTGVPTSDGVDFVILSNDGTELEVDVSSAETIGDVIDLINDHPLNNSGTTFVTAQIAEFGNGIELVDDSPNGTDSLAVRNADISRAAEHLGLIELGQSESNATVPATAAVGVADFSGANTDLTITAAQAGTQFSGATIVVTSSGSVTGNAASVAYDAPSNTLTIDVDPTATRATTVRDAINAEGTFTAALNTDQGPNDGSGLITDLGTVATLGEGSPERLTGRDVHPQETASVFNTLVRLKEALVEGNIPEINSAISTIESDILRVNFARAENGARHQALEATQTRLEDERVELQKSLSLEIDADLSEAISALTSRQIAMQASLRTAATLLQLTILDFV